MNTFFRSLTLATLAMSGISVQAADETFKPFVLAATSDQDLETVTTEVVAAPMSGSPLFTMSAVVKVPPQLEVDDLREALEFIGNEMGVDTKVFAHVDEK